MSTKSTRRQFIQAGIALTATGCVSGIGNDQKAGVTSPAKAAMHDPPVNTDGVQYRQLGKTDLNVSAVGYGVGIPPATHVIDRAIDMGVNYFDTSREYGPAENIFSKVIKGRRDKIYIATKSAAYNKKKILRDMDTSLKNLGTDYVDIYHLHARDTPWSIPESCIDALREVKQAGKARYLGFSCHNIAAMSDFAIKHKDVFDVVQTTYSFAIGPAREQYIQQLDDEGIGVIAMKVVKAITGLNMQTLMSQTGPKAEGKDGPLSGIKWVLRNPAIGTTVPYMKNMREFEMNYRAMAEPYTEADEQTLYAVNEQIRPYYCRMCYECEGQCPNGLPVTDMLRFKSYNDFDGNFFQAAAEFRKLPQDIQAVRCADCGTCAIECPNGVQVKERLMEAQDLLV